MELFALLQEFSDKQDLITKYRSDPTISMYSSSEIHLIAAIGDLEEPNVTALSERLHITRGGISKQIKKLIQQELITSFQKAGNSKNIYYSLTDAGLDVYRQHAQAHAAWQTQDQAFLDSFSREQLEYVKDFLTRYNQYVDQKLQERG